MFTLTMASLACKFHTWFNTWNQPHRHNFPAINTSWMSSNISSYAGWNCCDEWHLQMKIKPYTHSCNLSYTKIRHNLHVYKWKEEENSLTERRGNGWRGWGRGEGGGGGGAVGEGGRVGGDAVGMQKERASNGGYIFCFHKHMSKFVPLSYTYLTKPSSHTKNTHFTCTEKDHLQMMMGKYYENGLLTVCGRNSKMLQNEAPQTLVISYSFMQHTSDQIFHK